MPKFLLVASTLQNLCLQILQASQPMQGQERDTDTDCVMCPEWCHVFITGKCNSGYANVAKPSDGDAYTYSISEVERLANEPMGSQSIKRIQVYHCLPFLDCL